MTTRSAEVLLKMKTDQYKAEAEAAKRSTEALDRSVEATDRDLKKIPADAAKAAAAMKLLGGEVTTGTKSLDQIKTKLAETDVALKSAAREFNKTGSAASLQQVFQLRTDKQALEKLKKDVTTSLEGAGKDAGGGMMQGLAYAAGAAAPIVLPAVGAAILTGLGLGVIGAGIIGQLHSPQVLDGFAKFKADAGTTFTEATAPFGGVLTRELSAADALVQKVAPELTGMFQKTAPAADKLFQGLNGFVEKALPGLNRGLDGAVIVVDELGRDLPRVGKAIGDAFAGVADGAQGDAHALHDLLTVTDQLIVSGGRLAGTSGNLYEQMRSVATLKFDSPNLSMHSLQDTFDAVSTGGVTVLVKNILGIGDKSKDASYQVDNLGRSVSDLGPDAKTSADGLRYLNGELDSLLGQQLSYDQANDKFKTDLLDLKNQLDKNSRSIDDHSLAGLHNRDVLIGMIGDAEKARQAAINHAGGVNASKAAVDAANTAYQQSIDKLVGVAANAGISRAALNALAGNYQINVLLAIDAIYKSGLAQNVAAHDPGRYGSAGPPKHAEGAIRTAAVGRIIPPRNPGTLVGEPQTGGEALIPLQGISPMRAASLGQVAMSGYGLDVVPRGYQPAPRGGGSGTLRVELSFADGNDALASLLMKMQRTGDLQLTTTSV